MIAGKDKRSELYSKTVKDYTTYLRLAAKEFCASKSSA